MVISFFSNTRAGIRNAGARVPEKNGQISPCRVSEAMPACVGVTREVETAGITSTSLKMSREVD